METKARTDEKDQMHVETKARPEVQGPYLVKAPARGSVQRNWAEQGKSAAPWRLTNREVETDVSIHPNFVAPPLLPMPPPLPPVAPGIQVKASPPAVPKEIAQQTPKGHEVTLKETKEEVHSPASRPMSSKRKRTKSENAEKKMKKDRKKKDKKKKQKKQRKYKSTTSASSSSS